MEMNDHPVETEVLARIKELGLNTSRMTFEELAEATGFTKPQVEKTVRANSLPYVSARLSKRSTAPHYIPAPKHRQGTGQPGAESPSFRTRQTTMEMLSERQDQSRTLRALKQIRKLGKSTSAMTIPEIAEAADLHYLEVQRVVTEHRIRHL